MSLLKDFIFVEGVAMQSDVVFVNGKVQYIKEHYVCIVLTWIFIQIHELLSRTGYAKQL